MAALILTGLVIVTAFAWFSKSPMAGMMKSLVLILWLGLVPALGCMAYLAKASTRWAARLDDLGIELVDGERRIWRVEWLEVRRASIGEPHSEVPKSIAILHMLLEILSVPKLEGQSLILQGDGWTRSIPLRWPLVGDMPSADVLLGEVRRHGFVIDELA